MADWARKPVLACTTTSFSSLLMAEESEFAALSASAAHACSHSVKKEMDIIERNVIA